MTTEPTTDLAPDQGPKSPPPASSSFTVHAPPNRSVVYPNSECLDLECGPKWPSTRISIHCGSRALALDLQAAIDEVLRKHGVGA